MWCPCYRLSLTAMEKAAAFPLRAGFMPNSPMPMLDVCDWLLLMTVSSTTCGGMVPPFLFCGLSLLPPGCFPWQFCWGSVIVMGVKPVVMFVGVEKCVFGTWLCVCVCCVAAGPASSDVLNQQSLVCVVYNCTYFFLARAGRTQFELPPRMTYRCASDVRSLYKKNCVAAVSNP